MGKGKKRYHVLDVLRGLAVFLMILAHAVYFFTNRDNALFLGTERIGNLFCFTAFLVVSGAASYVAYLKSDRIHTAKRHIIKKILILLVSYYVIAIFVELKSLLQADGLETLKIVLNILSFRNLPSYTEYIPPFIIYPLIVLVFSRFFQKVSRNIFTTIAVSVVSYALGSLLYAVAVPDFFVPWKAFLAGGGDLYRFPILQYLPVYLIGMYWGMRLIKIRGLKKKLNFDLRAFGLFVLISLVLYYLNNQAIISFEFLRRWPPSVGFIALTTSLSFLAGSLYYLLGRLKKVPIVRDFFILLGQNAFSIFWAHILLLHLYRMVEGTQVSSPVAFALMFVVFLLLSIVLAIVLPFNLKLALTFEHKSHEEEEELLESSTLVKFEDEVIEGAQKEIGFLRRYFFPKDDGTKKRKRLIRKRHIIFMFLVAFVVVVLLFPAVLREARTYLSDKSAPSWWDDSFAYHKVIELRNTSTLSNISQGQTVAFSFDHKKLVEEGLAKPDGKDIRILSYTDDKYSPVDFSLANSWNINNTRIVLEIEDTLRGGEERDYYLYFGNYLANECLAADFAENETPAKYKVVLSDTKSHHVTLEVSRRWNLVESGSPASLRVIAHPQIDLHEPTGTYKVLNSSKTGSLNYSHGVFEADISLSGLPPGSYQVQVEVADNGVVYSSEKQAVFLSHPLYVTWTHDWEGYDVSTAYLNELERFSKKYDMPLTHFFNPRIYVTDTIDPERVAYLTSWLKSRLALGDGFALHLHMFYDYVEAAGLTPKKEPRWGGSRDDGYDVATTAYDVEETKKLISYGNKLLAAQDLPQADIYRAGGWFADLETLKALDELGFKADSSGRTRFPMGPNQLLVPWNLKPDQDPYFPSRSDHNSSSYRDPLSILEIPNNGADTYWFDAEEMIKRFDLNFDGDALTQKSQVTYLSHPQWFNEKRRQKIEKVFEHISRYKYDDDHGPVVYVTTEEVYEAWVK